MKVELLEELCKERGEKITNVIATLDLAKGSISNWRRGVIPNGEALVKLANYFEVSTDYLLGLTDEKTKFNAKSINNSAVVQGHNSSAINGKTQELSKEEEDIIKIYRTFDFKKRLEFLNKLSEIKE